MSFFAVPSLLDPEQWLTCNRADGNSKDTNDVATRQLRNGLLLSERIVISDGFVFDNPALWKLFSDDGWRELLTSSCDVLSASERRITVAARFRSWFYRDKEIVNPSAIRGSLLSDRQQRCAKENMRALAGSVTHRNDLSFAEYGQMMDFSGHQPTELHLDEFFGKCTLRRKNGNRHVEFGRRVRSLLESPTFFSQGIPKDERDRLERYIGDAQEQHISRSRLEREYPGFWNLYAPIINGLRQLTYASHLLDGGDQVAINPNIGLLSRSDDGLIRKCARQVAKKFDEAAHVLQSDGIATEKIIELRQQYDFRECVRQLCVAEANLVENFADPQCLRAYGRALDHWKDLLGPFLMATRKTAVPSFRTGEARQIAGDIAQGFVDMLLTWFITTTTGVPLGVPGKIASLSGSLAAKYAVLRGAGGAGRMAPCASISIRPGRIA